MKQNLESVAHQAKHDKELDKGGMKRSSHILMWPLYMLSCDDQTTDYHGQNTVNKKFCCGPEDLMLQSASGHVAGLHLAAVLLFDLVYQCPQSTTDMQPCHDCLFCQ